MMRMQNMIFLFGVVLSLTPFLAAADVRVASNRFTYICRVVVISEYGHRQRVLHDGRVGHGHIVTVDGGDGNLVCYSRSINPDNCKLGMTRWRCIRDTSRNRTVQFNVE